MWSRNTQRYMNLHRARQGGVTRTYTVGRSVTAVKLLTREVLSLTLDLLLYLFLIFDFLDFLPSLVLDLKLPVKKLFLDARCFQWSRQLY